ATAPGHRQPLRLQQPPLPACEPVRPAVARSRAPAHRRQSQDAAGEGLRRADARLRRGGPRGAHRHRGRDDHGRRAAQLRTAGPHRRPLLQLHTHHLPAHAGARRAARAAAGLPSAGRRPGRKRRRHRAERPMSVAGGDPAALGQAVAAVTPAAIERAHASIRPHVSLTPCLEAKTLSEMLGCRLFLKFENLQFTASFKERGALNFLLGLDEGARARGVVAMSAGNHAQGVAYHAARLGVRATIYMPLGTPFTKVSRTRALGADVRIEGASLSEAAAAARAFAAREAAVFLHPFDDPLVVAGQGTVAVEMLEQVPELDTLVVPVGGGGLIAGMAVAARARKPGIAIVGVEPEQYGGMHQTLRGLPVSVGGDTVAEGLAVREVGQLTAELVRRHVEDVLLVEEADIERAVCWLVDVEKTVVEGAGAAGL